MFVLILFAIIFILVLIIGGIAVSVQKEAESPEKEFDERQLLARNEAYKYSFNAGLIVNIIGFFVYKYNFFPHVAIDYFLLAPIVAGVLVFAVVAISKDAYLGFRQNRGKWFISMAAISALNAYCGFIASDSMSRISALNRVVAVLFLLILIYMGLNWMFNPKNTEEEE